MPWFNVDDGLYDHPKAHAAGNAALGLWVRLGSYSAKYRTDGHIPVETVRQLGTRSQITRLERAGMLERNGTHWVIHDYLDANPSAAEIDEQRAAKIERQRRYRERKSGQRDATRDASRDRATNTTTTPLPTDDEDQLESAGPNAESSSSNSNLETTIRIAAHAIATQANNQGKRYIAGIARNLRAERLDEITTLLEAGHTPVEAAGELAGSHVFARESARELTTE